MTEFHYTVDDKPFETDAHDMTPREILRKASYNPEKFYLIQILPTGEVSYKDNPDAHIKMENGMVFITAKIGPTPVT